MELCGLCEISCEDYILIDEETLELVKTRSDKAIASNYICSRDFEKYVRKWEVNSLNKKKHCSNPLNNHKKRSSFKLLEISTELRDTYISICELEAGKKLCQNCKVTLDEKLATVDSEIEEISESQQSVDSTGSVFKDDSQEIR